MDEKIIVGKLTKRSVHDDYLVCRVDADGRLEVVLVPGPAPLNVDVIDRAARLLGIVYGETAQLQQLTPVDAVTPANSLEAAVFPHVYDPVAGDWNRLREGAIIGSVLADVSDRWARELGLVDLSRVLGAALTPANPVISGIYGATGNRLNVHPDLSIPVSPSKVIVQAFDDIVGPPAAVAEGSAANLAVNTNHRGAGTNSVEFDKVAGGVLAGVSYTIAALDLSLYSTHAQIDFFIYLPTPGVGNIVQVYAALGTDNGNLWNWAVPIADLTLDAWNHIHLSIHDVAASLGVGADLSAITFCGIYVITDVAGATIANILVDQLIVKRTFEIAVTNSLATLYDGFAPTDVVSAGVFPYVYDPVAGDWNRAREGSQIGVLAVEDLGTHTNPERWLHANHWEADEVTIAVAGAPGEQNLGVVVPGGVTRRIRELTIRHEGSNDTVVTLLISGGATKVTIRMPPQSERVWSSQDGREFDPAEQSAVQTSDVTGGSTYVSAAGVEA